MPGLAGHSPDYRGVKIVTGAHFEPRWPHNGGHRDKSYFMQKP